MFDTRVVGKKIMELRKAKNLTQMDLADVIGVRFQAISNWERGNSMPDIAKLPEIAEYLGCSIDHLLGASKETNMVKDIINDTLEESSDLKDLNDLKDIAPILKPKDVDQLLENVMKSESFSELNDLHQIAPFISTDYLSSLVDQLDLSGNFDDIISLAPFLSKESLTKVSKNILENEDLEKLSSLAPFLERTFLDELVISKIEEGDLKTLSTLYPFLSTTVIEKISDEARNKNDFESLSEMAPFLSSQYLDELVELEGDKFSGLFPFVSKEKLTQMAEDAYKSGDIKTLISLAPFTSDGVLDQLTVKNLDGEIKLDLVPLYPFLQKSTLAGLAERMFKEKKMKEMSSIAPFL